jgi:hypothetical protein
MKGTCLTARYPQVSLLPPHCTTSVATSPTRLQRLRFALHGTSLASGAEFPDHPARRHSRFRPISTGVGDQASLQWRLVTSQVPQSSAYPSCPIHATYGKFRHVEPTYFTTWSSRHQDLVDPSWRKCLQIHRDGCGPVDDLLRYDARRV